MQVNVHEAKTHLSRLVERAAAGEEVVIAKAGKPVAKLVAYDADRTPRKPGFLKGQIWLGPDWDAPELNEEIARELDGGSIFPGQEERQG